MGPSFSLISARAAFAVALASPQKTITGGGIVVEYVTREDAILRLS